jgi:6-phospho-3-hexuloisomerase
MTSSTTLTTIIAELAAAGGQIEQEEFTPLCDALLAAKRVFITGAGRSGFVARGFANRLLHLGLAVSFVGEPTTPPIRTDDLLVVISGSGRTAGLVAMAEKAHSAGAAVATITTDTAGPIGQLATAHLALPGQTRLGADIQPTVATSIQPVGTLFEQLAWLACDSLIVLLRERTGQSNDELIERHANLE